MAGRNRVAVDKVVKALRELGRLERVDEAKVTAARSLADAVDSDPLNAALWRQYRESIAVLGADGGGTDDSFSDLMREFGNTKVGDPPAS